MVVGSLGLPQSPLNTLPYLALGPPWSSRPVCSLQMVMSDPPGYIATCLWASTDFIQRRVHSRYLRPWGNPVKETFGGQLTLWENLFQFCVCPRDVAVPKMRPSPSTSEDCHSHRRASPASPASPCRLVRPSRGSRPGCPSQSLATTGRGESFSFLVSTVCFAALVLPNPPSRWTQIPLLPLRVSGETGFIIHTSLRGSGGNDAKCCG